MGIENDLQNIKNIRLKILEMAYQAREGHIPSSFSVVELLYGIYAGMSQDDTFFLSKGHASMALYAVLAHFGYLDPAALNGFCRYSSNLGGHPHGNKIKHIMNSSGSLGQGLPTAAGYALAKKIKNEPGRVFCLIGDGESNEGTVWETAIYAQQLKLTNLVCVLDNNNSQIRAITTINLAEKFMSFGWKIYEIDGHDFNWIDCALFNKEIQGTNRPVCVVARTVKGKGIKEMENNFAWHHRAPNDSEFPLFVEELSN